MFNIELAVLTEKVMYVFTFLMAMKAEPNLIQVQFHSLKSKVLPCIDTRYRSQCYIIYHRQYYEHFLIIILTFCVACNIVNARSNLVRVSKIKVRYRRTCTMICYQTHHRSEVGKCFDAAHYKGPAEAPVQVEQTLKLPMV
jgi:hypothetical protein